MKSANGVYLRYRLSHCMILMYNFVGNYVFVTDFFFGTIIGHTDTRFANKKKD